MNKLWQRTWRLMAAHSSCRFRRMRRADSRLVMRLHAKRLGSAILLHLSTQHAHGSVPLSYSSAGKRAQQFSKPV